MQTMQGRRCLSLDNNEALSEYREEIIPREAKSSFFRAFAFTQFVGDSVRKKLAQKFRAPTQSKSGFCSLGLKSLSILPVKKFGCAATNALVMGGPGRAARCQAGNTRGEKSTQNSNSTFLFNLPYCLGANGGEGKKFSGKVENL